MKICSNDVRYKCEYYTDDEIPSVRRGRLGRIQLSARSYQRIRNLSRTIAELAASDQIEVNHVAETTQYRPRQHLPK